MDGFDLSTLAGAQAAPASSETLIGAPSTTEGHQSPAAGENAPSGLPTVVEMTREVLETVVVYSQFVPVFLTAYSSKDVSSSQMVSTLTPLVTSYQGKVLLATVDVVKEPDIVASLGVQQVPTIVVLAQGRAMDMIDGQAISEPQLRGWIDAILKATEGRLREISPAVREEIQRAFGTSPTEDVPPPRTVVDDAEELFVKGEEDAALELLRHHLAQHPKDHDAASALSRLDMLQRSFNASDDAIAYADEHPEDSEAQCTAADVDMSLGNAEAAYGRLLDTIARTTGDEKNQVRQHLVSLFAIADASDPVVIRARQKLASLLY